MRVISGTARGTRLKRVRGDSTRPIMDRVKESLFNIIGQAVHDSHWLDLFAGTGQVAIEALSRGAASAVLIDRAPAAVRVIHDNLARTRLAERAVVGQIDSFRFLRDPAPRPFDFIYIAPPQYKGLWSAALREIDERAGAWLAPDGEVIVQIDPDEDEPPELANLARADERRYGRTLLIFYRWSPAPEAPAP